MDTETLPYLLTPDLDAPFWREGRSGLASASCFAFCEAAISYGLDTRCDTVDSSRGDAQAGYYSYGN
jgi:hypothetical protein